MGNKAHMHLDDNKIVKKSKFSGEIRRLNR